MKLPSPTILQMNPALEPFASIWPQPAMRVDGMNSNALLGIEGPPAKSVSGVSEDITNHARALLTLLSHATAQIPPPRFNNSESDPQDVPDSVFRPLPFMTSAFPIGPVDSDLLVSLQNAIDAFQIAQQSAVFNHSPSPVLQVTEGIFAPPNTPIASPDIRKQLLANGRRLTQSAPLTIPNLGQSAGEPGVHHGIHAPQAAFEAFVADQNRRNSKEVMLISGMLSSEIAISETNNWAQLHNFQ